MKELREYLMGHPQLKLEFHGKDIFVYGIKISNFECETLYWEDNILAKGITENIEKYFTYSMKSVLITFSYPIKHPFIKQDGIIFHGCELKEKAQKAEQIS